MPAPTPPPRSGPRPRKTPIRSPRGCLPLRDSARRRLRIARPQALFGQVLCQYDALVECETHGQRPLARAWAAPPRLLGRKAILPAHRLEGKGPLVPCAGTRALDDRHELGVGRERDAFPIVVLRQWHDRHNRPAALSYDNGLTEPFPRVVGEGTSDLSQLHALHLSCTSSPPIRTLSRSLTPTARIFTTRSGFSSTSKYTRSWPSRSSQGATWFGRRRFRLRVSFLGSNASRAGSEPRILARSRALRPARCESASRVISIR